MKRILFPLVLIAVIAVWCKPSFARQVVNANALLSADGGLNGVDITGAVTLSVGVAGGPKTDIFTNNPLLNSVDPAVKVTGANDASMVSFFSSSSVYGDMGQTPALFLHSITVNTGATVDFLKSVYSTDLFVGGTGIANFKGGATSTNTVRLQFTGVGGTISLDPGTLVTGALTTTGGDDTGTLSLGSGSKLTGAVGALTAGLHSITVVGGSSSQPPSGVSATIQGAVSDIHSLTLGTNTLNIAGALTIATNGVIDTTLGSATVYGNIVVTGGASDLGTGLTVRVTVPTTTDVPVGTLFNIVTGAGVNALATVDPTNSLYTFSIEPVAAGGATIKVLTVPLRVPIDNPPANPVTPIAAPVAQALVDAPASADVSVVRAAINALANADDVVNAEAQLAPLAPALAAPLITFQGIRQFQDLWLARLDQCIEFAKPWTKKEDSICPGNKPNSAWWVKGVGYWGLRKDSSNYKGFETRILGTMMAYDVPFGDNTRGGLGVGYARTDIDGKFFDTSTNFDTYRAMAYIGHEPGPWFVNAGLSFGWNEYTNKRHIQFTGMDRTANSKYAGQDYTAFASTGYHVLAKKFAVTPFGSLQYTRVNIGSYHENGAGDINLRVNSQGYDFYESGLGIKAARDFVYRGGSIIPDVHFKWLHDFSNPTLEQTARFNYQGTSTFVTHGLKISDDTYNVGVGLNLLQCTCRETDWSVEAGYDYEWRNDNYSANIASVRVTKRF